MFEPEQVKSYRRQLGAMAQRADDPEALHELAQLAAELDALVRLRAHALHGEGYSWADLGRPAGITRQGALRRWQVTAAAVAAAERFMAALGRPTPPAAAAPAPAPSGDELVEWSERIAERECEDCGALFDTLAARCRHRC